MLHFVIRLLVTALAVLLASIVVPGLRVRSFGSALVFAFVLAILAKLLFGLLVLLSLPLVLLTFGLFLLVINAFIFLLAGKIVGGVEVRGFGSAFLASLVVTIITTVTYHYTSTFNHSWSSSSSSWSSTSSASSSSSSTSSSSFSSFLLR